ncbi:hypothetical protein OF001_U300047 [Pseudomonas sp. OF001]|nr:hypothetical protein OF001_U300047 [Pseudomonas sp. OF001]
MRGPQIVSLRARVGTVAVPTLNLKNIPQLAVLIQSHIHLFHRLHHPALTAIQMSRRDQQCLCQPRAIVLLVEQALKRWHRRNHQHAAYPVVTHFPYELYVKPRPVDVLLDELPMLHAGVTKKRAQRQLRVSIRHEHSFSCKNINYS